MYTSAGCGAANPPAMSTASRPPDSTNLKPKAPARPLRELLRLFLKLGITAFGGPAAHIAMMHEEVVNRRKWLTEQEFLDLLGGTNLIPGPNSTEMAIHIGYLRGGYPGLFVAGVSFILPAMLIVMGLAWAYTNYGTIPQAESVLYGVKPVVVAIIVQALWTLGRKALRGPDIALVVLAVPLAYFAGVNEIALLLVGGFISWSFARGRDGSRPESVLAAQIAWRLPWAVAAAAPFSLPILFFTFLKIGAVLYGSGYVLLAFLRADFVNRLGWLTDTQLLDAVAVGQVTPGPVFTTATFIGYLLGGIPGALLATIGIFLPAFIFVAASNPFIARMRGSPSISAFLDGVNAASLGLMAAVTIQLGRASLIDVLAIGIFLGSALALLRFRLNPTWLIAAGALLGAVGHWVLG